LNYGGRLQFSHAPRPSRHVPALTAGASFDVICNARCVAGLRIRGLTLRVKANYIANPTNFYINLQLSSTEAHS